MYIYVLLWLGNGSETPMMGESEEKNMRLFFDEKVAKAYADKHNIIHYHIEMMWVHDEV